jgi:hypothetical protein
MKVISFVIFVVLSYAFAWSQLATIGITNATMYLWVEPTYGRTVGAMAVMMTYVVTPAILASVVWLIPYGICAYKRDLSAQ